MHRVRAAITSGEGSAERLIARKAARARRAADAAAQACLDPALVARAGEQALSRQERAAAIEALRNESVPRDDTLAHWTTTADAGRAPPPVYPHGARRDGDDAEDEPSLAGELVPRRVSRTADTRREDRIFGAIDRARITFRGADHDVRVVNTSARGLQIESDLKAHIAEELTIQLDVGPARPCYVRWIRAGRIGLGFREQDLSS